MLATTESNSCQQTVFALLILASATMMAGRVLAVDEATLGGNDRSRWCTILALVDHGTYEIGRREYNSDGTYYDSGITTERNWQTIDKFLHPDSQAFYSGKPPLFPTVAALVYWVLKNMLGWSFSNHRMEVIRCTLMVVNCVPMTIYLVLIGRMLAQFGRTAWGRLFLMAAACFGTYLTTFAIVLNNHTVAACFVLFALYQAFMPSPARHGLDRSWLRFAAAGFLASCAAAADLPAMAFLAWLGIVLFRRSARLTLCSFIPAAALPAAAFLLTNYLAIGQFKPAYSEVDGPWYTYQGSYWEAGARKGIDAAGEKESKFDYAFHLVLGHHGLFSLTPVFLLGLSGLLSELTGDNHKASLASTELKIIAVDEAGHQNSVRTLSVGVWFLTIVIVGFYVLKTDNYGGSTAGPRWLFWLTPLLLLSASPEADAWSEQRKTRLLGYGCLAVSIFSVYFSAGRPWGGPWLYQFMKWQGWIGY